MSTPSSRGTPGYRAPELLREEGARFSPKVDIWALGCVMYELCTGRKAFKDDFAVYMSAMNPPVYLNCHMDGVDDKINAQLQLVFQSMLELDPRKRPSADFLVTTFDDYLGHCSNTSEMRGKQ